MITDIYFKITGLVHEFADHLAGGDPMAKGLISIAILGSLVAALRREPKRIYSFLYTRLSFMTKLMYVGEDDQEAEIQEAISQYVLTKTSRRVYQTTRHDDTLISSQGMGSYWFWDKGALVRFSRSRETKDKVEVNTVILRTFGKDVRNYINSIPNVKEVLEAGRGKRFYMYYNSNSYPERWINASEILPAPQLVIDPEIKKILDNAIDFFKNNKDWYVLRGLPYKLSIMLYGPPGTGKTCMTRYIADYLNWSIGSITGTDSRALGRMIRRSGTRDMVISVQDVESHFRIGHRDPAHYEGKKHEAPKEKRRKVEDEKDETDNEKEAAYNSSDLGNWLDVLQGDIPLNNKVIVFSTNHLEKIDPAFFRPGRIDLCLCVTNLKYAQANEFFQRYYETTDNLPLEFEVQEFPGSRLFNAFTLSPMDKEGFINELRKINHEVNPTVDQ